MRKINSMFLILINSILFSLLLFNNTNAACYTYVKDGKTGESCYDDSKSKFNQNSDGTYTKVGETKFIDPSSGKSIETNSDDYKNLSPDQKAAYSQPATYSEQAKKDTERIEQVSIDKGAAERQDLINKGYDVKEGNDGTSTTETPTTSTLIGQPNDEVDGNTDQTKSTIDTPTDSTTLNGQPNDEVDGNTSTYSSEDLNSVTTSSEPSPTTVIVTEKIPGVKCDYIGDSSNGPPVPESLSKPENRKYKCTIKPGFQSVMDLVRGLIKYATFLTALIGVLMLVVSGIHLSISGIDSEGKAKAKGQFTKIIGGLVLLFLIGFVLNTVAPWIYQ